MKNVDIIAAEIKKAIDNKTIGPDETLNTYDGWIYSGYQVKRGSKAITSCLLWSKKNGKFFRQNKSLFSSAQVEKSVEESKTIQNEPEQIPEQIPEEMAVPDVIVIESIYDHWDIKINTSLIPDCTTKQIRGMVKLLAQAYHGPGDDDYDLKLKQIERCLMDAHKLAKYRDDTKEIKRLNKLTRIVNPEWASDELIKFNRKDTFTRIIGNSGKSMQITCLAPSFDRSGYKFFICKDAKTGRWHIIECRSGLAAISDSTKSKAIDDFIKREHIIMDALKKMDLDAAEKKKLSLPVLDGYEVAA